MRAEGSRKKYTREFRLQAVELSDQPGASVQQTAADLGIEVKYLYRWRYELKRCAGETSPKNGRRSASEEELAQLRREVAELRMERDILKKAAAYFARHQQ
jgi:transposase